MTPGRRLRRSLPAVLAALVVAAGCSGDPEPQPEPQPEPSTPQASATETPADDTAPLLGASHVLVPDPAGDGLLAISGPPEEVGYDGALVVWRWDGEGWSEVVPEEPWPSARSFFAAAYDPERDVLVLHGGDTATGPSSETWEWDGEAWSSYPGPAGGPRMSAAMAFDPESSAVVMYGGDDGAGEVKNDTWGWSPEGWRKQSAAGPRPHRFPAALAAGAGGLVLYGGHQVVDEDLPPSLGDTWTWDGRAWSRAPDAGGPGELVNAGTVVHPRHGTLLVGGSDFDDESGDVWRWTRDGWKLLAEDVFPPRQAFGIAYDEARDVVVMTGGVVEPGEITRHQDLWEWSGDPARAAQRIVDRPPA